MNFSPFSYRYFLHITILFLFTITLTFIGDGLNFPLPWLLIPVFVGIAWTFINQKHQCLPKYFSVIGQAILAILTASRFSFDTFTTAQSYFFPLLMCIVVTASFSVLNGYLIYKFADIDLSSSFLGSIPGAGASFVAMSEDMGGDTMAVAVLQYSRILIVSVIVPIIAHFYKTPTPLIPVNIATQSLNLLPSLPMPINLIIISSCAYIGIQIGKIIKLPSNLFLAPFLSCLLLFCFFPYEITLPTSIFQGGLLLLGLSIGVKFEIQALQKLLKAVLLQIVLVLILIAVCFFCGYGFHLITQVDTLTAFLGSTPGGLSSVMATVIQLEGNSSFVLAMQMTRMLLILMLSPFFATSLLKKEENQHI
ncbi:MAG: AbrB family transcriptional regulator [Cyanobacteria bacterium]|nr:AbrB family transcriptional regulator [Cyanobacteria bacterium CG_2015-16_32_12]NCO77342.1 AbrB family transcriptional regulator [Cyanobacteria bacterium CG_2015-22_32_23]NCQ04123.1 AbrB family transcriptional regulator [Cyanobacteria bacterium CG_2015-09_32_10]NCQ42540.1 AbrB family transcriptional regulator [Cyanobacteria bacterium CG_2015-04_32_10]NCS83878.1 AbrB family transcriptional regulator [Cyanobacteria bacterium CG_2015-02_32_10]